MKRYSTVESANTAVIDEIVRTLGSHGPLLPAEQELLMAVFDSFPILKEVSRRLGLPDGDACLSRAVVRAMDDLANDSIVVEDLQAELEAFCDDNAWAESMLAQVRERAVLDSMPNVVQHVAGWVLETLAAAVAGDPQARTQLFAALEARTSAELAGLLSQGAGATARETNLQSAAVLFEGSPTVSEALAPLLEMHRDVIEWLREEVTKKPVAINLARRKASLAVVRGAGLGKAAGPRRPVILSTPGGEPDRAIGAFRASLVWKSGRPTIELTVDGADLGLTTDSAELTLTAGFPPEVEATWSDWVLAGTLTKEVAADPSGLLLLSATLTESPLPPDSVEAAPGALEDWIRTLVLSIDERSES
mgnify:CR=1 FL=1